MLSVLSQNQSATVAERREKAGKKETDINNSTKFLLSHPSPNGFGTAKSAFDVHLLNLVPFLSGHGFEGLVAENASVVYEDLVGEGWLVSSRM